MPTPGKPDKAGRRTPPAFSPEKPAGSPVAAVEAMIAGLARLVDGQRQFAEEFGLPYGRVFDDAFEPFKSRDTREVLRDWVPSDEGPEHLQQLLLNIAHHQLAVLQAAEHVVGRSVQPMDRWLCRALQRARGASGEASDLALAYTTAREHLASELPTEAVSC